jgi:RNA polymerase subunit RPABC4/transcription elongation factor Spt4
VPRKCKTCKQVVIHDSRNCPNRAPQQWYKGTWP